jgi:hypothetical protein
MRELFRNGSVVLERYFECLSELSRIVKKRSGSEGLPDSEEIVKRVWK